MSFVCRLPLSLRLLEDMINKLQLWYLFRWNILLVNTESSCEPSNSWVSFLNWTSWIVFIDLVFTQSWAVYKNFYSMLKYCLTEAFLLSQLLLKVSVNVGLLYQVWESYTAVRWRLLTYVVGKLCGVSMIIRNSILSETLLIRKKVWSDHTQFCVLLNDSWRKCCLLKTPKSIQWCICCAIILRGRHWYFLI